MIISEKQLLTLITYTTDFIFGDLSNEFRGPLESLLREIYDQQPETLIKIGELKGKAE